MIETLRKLYIARSRMRKESDNFKHINQSWELGYCTGLDNAIGIVLEIEQEIAQDLGADAQESKTSGGSDG